MLDTLHISASQQQIAPTLGQHPALASIQHHQEANSSKGATGDGGGGFVVSMTPVKNLHSFLDLGFLVLTPTEILQYFYKSGT